MPNIEIHGLNRTESAPLSKAIAKAIKEHASDLVEEAVITLCDDHCVDLEDKRQPFIRICSSEPAHFEVLTAVLKQFKLDIEWLELKGFIPAKG